MTPQQKAIELIDSFMDLSEEQEYNTPRYMSKDMAVKCVLMCCNQVLGDMGADRGYSFWSEVKLEIEKL
jgi:hypothetical protein